MEPQCVHCGFCLPVCPTYEVLGTEMDSPRGRLDLMRALEEGRIEATEPVVRHLDLCLGCRACESECPSGVRFGARLEQARFRLRGTRERPAGRRIAESLILRAVGAAPALQAAGVRLLAGAHRLGLPHLASSARLEGILPDRLLAAARLLAEAPPRVAGFPEITPARGTPRLRVGLLLGCVNRWMFPEVNEATARLLAAAGCEVLAPAGQGCCGALHAHAGDREGARRLAAANIALFDKAGPLDAIAVNAAGCGSVMKEYGALFEEGIEPGPAGGERPPRRSPGIAGARAAERAGSPGLAGERVGEWAARFAASVRDALELLAEIGPPPFVHEVRGSVAYHDACHLAHAQRIRVQPRRLLEAVPGLRLVPLADSDRCCGSAGIYNLLHPTVASKILRLKLERLRESGAEVVAAANPGCLLQIAAGARQARMPLTARHPLEILDEACAPGD